jgi:probable F420-dependent oxidoreductase
VTSSAASTARALPTLGVWGDSLSDWVDACVAAEDAGLAAVWSNELHRSAFVPLAAAAARTSRITLGTAISLAFVRSPMVTALEALDLDEVSGGRLVLGLGSGVQRLIEAWHGAAFDKPVGRMRQTVEVIRRIVADADLGEPIDAGGELVSTRVRGWRRPVVPVRRSIPVYLAAVGPALTKLAGEIADGWIAHELGSPAYLRERILPFLEEGFAVSGRARSDFTIVASACCSVLPDGDEARRAAAHQVAFYASVKTYQEFFAFHGFEAEAVVCQERFRAGDKARMADAVSDEMVDALTISGTPDEVRAKLRQYDGLADLLKLGPPTHVGDPDLTAAAQRGILEVCAS